MMRSRLKVIFLVLAGIIGLCVLGLVVFAVILLHDIPDVTNLESLKIAQSTIVYDRNGKELYKIHGEENRKFVALKEISPFLVKATIAIEDRRFYEHQGFDPVGIFRALYQNVSSHGEEMQGGSTLTQQLVKNVFLTPERTIQRKLKELVLAFIIEQKYSKDKILELYLNQIPYGSNAYGIEQASQTYFQKTSSGLTLAEAAVLASLPKAPSFYSPYGTNKNELMGYCKFSTGENVGDSGGDTDGEYTVTLKAKKAATITANVDGETQKIALAAGEEQELVFTTKLELTLATAGTVDASWSTKKLDFKGKKTLTVASADIDKLKEAIGNEAKSSTQVVEKPCTSMDDPRYIKGRKDRVLISMLETQMITQAEMDQAWKVANKVVFQKYREPITYPHFVFYVKEYLEKKYGKDVVERGGLKVYTTLDSDLQDIAEKALKNQSAKNVSVGARNAALVSADPRTGEILAMVGSRDYWDEEIDGKVNVATSYRQPGSSFKPLVYGNFFENGNGGPGSVLWDVETRFGGGIPPKNFDGTFSGPMTVRKALDASRNIPAIKAFFLGGEEDKLLNFVAKLGITNLKDYREKTNLVRSNNDKFYYGWPLGIGSGEVRLLDMVGAYGVYANKGVRVPLTPIKEVLDASGNVVEELKGADSGEKVLDPRIAFLISDILSDNAARPAGWNRYLVVPGTKAAVKTGTSNKRINDSLRLPSDLWTMGYTPYLATGVWVGNTKGGALTIRAEGLTNAAPMWVAYMTEATKLIRSRDKDVETEFKRPDGIVSVTISALSGLRAGSGTPADFRVTDLFLKEKAPSGVDGGAKSVKIDKRNRLLATAKCPPEVVVDAYIANVHSEMPNNPNWENPVRAWISGRLGGESGIGGLIAQAPTQESPLCKDVAPEDMPSVSIMAPASGSYVGTGKVTVRLGVHAPAGLQKSEVYFDGALASSASADPFESLSVTIPASTNIGSSHSIKAVVLDKNYMQATATIEVLVDEDTGKPTVSISSPKAGASYAPGETVRLMVDAFDQGGSITKVDFIWDGSFISSKAAGPYSYTYTIPASATSGKHAIGAIAVDGKGNTTKATVSITVTGGAAPEHPAAANANLNGE